MMSEIRAALEALISAGEVVEIRALWPEPGRTDSGYYTDLAAAARDAAERSEAGARGVYYSLNFLQPTCLERSPNKMALRARQATADADVLRRRWLLVDVDPDRPSGTNATKAELEAARKVADQVELYMVSEIGLLPTKVMSGNGYGLLYRVDLPNTEEWSAHIKAFLTEVASLFSSPTAHVDKSVWNASRISRLPGTVNRKGPPSEDRPQRTAQLLSIGCPGLVPAEWLARFMPPEEVRPAQEARADRGDAFRRAQLYMAERKPAVEGQNGDQLLYDTVGVLWHDFALPEDQAWDLLAAWNARNLPPFSDRQLRGKVARVASRNFSKPRGWKLDEPLRHAGASPGAAGISKPGPLAGTLDVGTALERALLTLLDTANPWRGSPDELHAAVQIGSAPNSLGRHLANNLDRLSGKGIFATSEIVGTGNNRKRVWVISTMQADPDADPRRLDRRQADPGAVLDRLDRFEADPDADPNSLDRQQADPGAVLDRLDRFEADPDADPNSLDRQQADPGAVLDRHDADPGGDLDRHEDWSTVTGEDPTVRPPAPPRPPKVPPRDGDGQGEPPEPEDEEHERLNRFMCTDLGNAEAILYLYGKRLRWHATAGKWLIWMGKHWTLDESNTVLSWANHTIRKRRAAGAAKGDMDIVKWAVKCESSNARNCALAQVQAHPYIVKHARDLDRDLWKLSVANGTLDLRTGRLDAHRPEDYITKLVPIKYDPDAKCPLWDAFLQQMHAGDTQTIEYLQQAAGYSLTGNTSEHAVFIMHGLGGNGKSLFVEILGECLGEYARNARSEMFAEKPIQDAISNALARLDGARLVKASETNQAFKLDEAQIKSLSGEDTVTARFLHKEFFEFCPRFKVWLTTNHKPIVQGTDYGIWRRLKLIPWNVQIAKEKADKGLKDKLRRELPGILAWAVRGCLAWQAAGRLVDPPAVAQAIREYQEEQDTLGGFIRECCSTDHPLFEESVSVLYKAYRDWADAQGMRCPMAQRGMTRKLTEKGFVYMQAGKFRVGYIKGLKVVASRAPINRENPPEIAEAKDKGILDGLF